MTRGSGDPGAGAGATIGARVATHLARAVAETKVRLGPHQAAIVQKILADFTNHVSDEIRGVMSPLWMTIADSPDTAPWLRDLARRLGQERGQAWTWIAGTSTSLAMGGGLGLLLSNELQPVIGAAVRGNPHMPLSPADAAAAVAQGLVSEDFGYGDAGQWGISRGRFRELVELNRRLPTLSDVLDSLNRGVYGRAHAVGLLQRMGYHGTSIEHLLDLRHHVIPLPDLAAMWNRSIVDDADGAALARRVGASPEQWRQYTELHGEPLPIQDLLTAQRRGIIDATRARRGWVQGPVRNEWFDVAQELQYAPMSTVEAADAALQGHLDEGAARRIAMENGLRGEDFEIMLRSAGLPPGVELASEALNRGLMSIEEFRAAFLESRLKNKYVDLYVKLRHRVVPQETVRRVYRAGVWDRAKALERLRWTGFSPEDAEDLLAADSVDTVSAERDLTKTEIVTLYTDRAIDATTLRGWLTDLGYPPDQADWIIALADARRARRHSDAVIARVRAGYVAGRLDIASVSSLMDSLRIPAGQREDLITLWDLEKLALTRGLTPAQVKSAMRKGLIDQGEAVARLTRDGYSEDDAAILLAI